MKFDKSDSLKPSGGTAPEIYGRGSAESVKVPEWHISIRRPVGDDNVQSSEAYIDHNNLIPNGSVLHDYGVQHDKEGWISLVRRCNDRDECIHIPLLSLLITPPRCPDGLGCRRVSSLRTMWLWQSFRKFEDCMIALIASALDLAAPPVRSCGLALLLR